MKRIIGAAMLIAATPAAWAQDVRPSAEEPASYFSLSAGAIAGGEFGYDLPGGNVEVETETGYGVTAAFGRSFTPNIRGEASLTYSEQDIDFVRWNGAPPSILLFQPPGSVTAWSLDATGYYDFTTTGNLRPYVGAGIGIASVDVDDTVMLENGTAVKARLAAGARWLTSGNTSFFVEGRYDIHWMDVDQVVALGDVDTNLDMDSLGLFAGVRFGF